MNTFHEKAHQLYAELAHHVHNMRTDEALKITTDLMKLRNQATTSDEHDAIQFTVFSPVRYGKFSFNPEKARLALPIVREFLTEVMKKDCKFTRSGVTLNVTCHLATFEAELLVELVGAMLCGRYADDYIAVVNVHLDDQIVSVNTPQKFIHDLDKVELIERLELAYRKALAKHKGNLNVEK